MKKDVALTDISNLPIVAMPSTSSAIDGWNTLSRHKQQENLFIKKHKEASPSSADEASLDIDMVTPMDGM